MLVWYKHSWFHLPCTLKHLQKCYRLSCRVVSVLPPLPHPRGFSFNPGRSRCVGAAPAACPRILIPQHHSSTDYSSPALAPLCDLRELSSSCDLWQRHLRNLCIHLQLERWTQLHPACQHLAFLSKATSISSSHGTVGSVTMAFLEDVDQTRISGWYLEELNQLSASSAVPGESSRYGPCDGPAAPSSLANTGSKKVLFVDSPDCPIIIKTTFLTYQIRRQTFL